MKERPSYSGAPFVLEQAGDSRTTDFDVLDKADVSIPKQEPQDWRL